jgi:hypothetical protein
MLYVQVKFLVMCAVKLVSLEMGFSPMFRKCFDSLGVLMGSRWLKQLPKREPHSGLLIRVWTVCVGVKITVSNRVRRNLKKTCWLEQGPAGNRSGSGAAAQAESGKDGAVIVGKGGCMWDWHPQRWRRAGVRADWREA